MLNTRWKRKGRGTPEDRLVSGTHTILKVDIFRVGARESERAGYLLYRGAEILGRFDTPAEAKCEADKTGSEGGRRVPLSKLGGEGKRRGKSRVSEGKRAAYASTSGR